MTSNVQTPAGFTDVNDDALGAIEGGRNPLFDVADAIRGAIESAATTFGKFIAGLF
jgi:hypothetical protein